MRVTYTATEGLDLLGSEIGAWLAETTAGTTNPELLSNGGFTSNTTSWAAVNGATLASVSSELRITANGTSYPAATQAITTVIGQAYTITCTARRGTCTANVTLDVSGLETHTDSSSLTTNDALSVSFTATDTYYLVSLIIDGTTVAGETAYFDTVVSTISSNDLSATGIDLDATGTLTKSAVATGAELMQFTGWSASNYLSRAYGADLDITGAITVLAWIKPANLTGSQAVCGNRRTGSGDYGGYGLNVEAGKLRFTAVDGAGASVHAADASDISTTDWTLAVGTMSAAGLLSIYKNGVLVDTTASGVIGATATLFSVGVTNVSGSVSNAFSGGIAPVCVIPAALTAAQILNIYNNEKNLFKTYSPYRLIGTDYSLDLDVSALDNEESPISNSVKSLGGNQETVFIRNEKYTGLTITNLEGSDLPTMRNFLRSVNSGQTFTFDGYGTVAVPVDPVTVIADPGFQERRNGNSDYFDISMRVREQE